MSKTFTEQQARDIQYEGTVWDEEGNELFTVVHDEITDSDQEKGSIEKYYVIEELATGKYFAGCLGQSPWYKQDEVNAKEEWVEVKRKEITTVTYE